MPLIGTLRAIEFAEVLTEIDTMQEYSIALKILTGLPKIRPVGQVGE